jgi:hypothetical protein
MLLRVMDEMQSLRRGFIGKEKILQNLMNKMNKCSLLYILEYFIFSEFIPLRNVYING